METEETRIWFTLSKDVYVSFNSMEQLLLYNTSNGQSLIVSNSKCIELIKKIYEPSNLGVIDLENIEFKFYKGKTVVIVAHRLSTVKNADQIVVLDDGKIVETGNHRELTDKRGAYYHLVKNQLELGN